MFILTKEASYSWPVRISLPIDGGRFESQSFDAMFKRIVQSRIKALVEGNDKDLCKEVLVGWKGITDEKKEAIPFSESALETLLDFPQMAKAIAVAYLESVAGAKTKNS